MPIEFLIVEMDDQELAFLIVEMDDQELAFLIDEIIAEEWNDERPIHFHDEDDSANED